LHGIVFHLHTVSTFGSYFSFKLYAIYVFACHFSTMLRVYNYCNLATCCSELVLYILYEEFVCLEFELFFFQTLTSREGSSLKQ
jgi:uncharacterized membrane protein YjjB (DUF3815 family)